MTRRRLGTVIPVVVLLLFTLSCAVFTDAVKPTQVVDIAPMVGKSFQELTATLGPSREQGICYAWDLPEGELSVCYEIRDQAKRSMSSISYSFPPAPLFAPRMAAGSPEEMAELVRVDIRGRKPDSEFQGGYAYNDLVLNGKAVDVAFDGGPKTIVGVRVHLK